MTETTLLHTRGEEVLTALDPLTAVRARLGRLDALAPGFFDLTIESAFGAVVSRPGLSLRDRELVTIAALCALGRERQLAVHLDYAITLGVARRSLAEALIQMAVYAGWPAAVTGLEVLNVVAAKRLAARYEIGDVTISVISDGFAPMPLAMFAVGLEPAEAEEVARRLGDLATPGPVPLNGLVVERDGKLVVVDPGSGPHDGPSGHGLVPPSEGHFLRSFCAAGYDPAEVDLVILTHGHHDHAGCLAASSDEFPFPRAQVAIAEDEYVHWRDHGDLGAAQLPDVVREGVRAVGAEFTAAIADRVTWLRDGEAVAPGIRALTAPGHTPGHTALVLETGEQDVLLGADFAGHEAISLPYPESHHAADYDPAQAIDSRKRLLRQAVDEDLLVHGFHFAAPGLGRVEPDGRGWRFSPLDTTA